MVGGGYLAENNFMLGDLSQDLQKKILQKKNSLYKISEIVDMVGEDHPLVHKRLEQFVKEKGGNPERVFVKNGLIHFRNCVTYNAFIDSLKPELTNNTHSYLRTLKYSHDNISPENRRWTSVLRSRMFLQFMEEYSVKDIYKTFDEIKNLVKIVSGEIDPNDIESLLYHIYRYTMGDMAYDDINGFLDKINITVDDIFREIIDEQLMPEILESINTMYRAKISKKDIHGNNLTYYLSKKLKTKADLLNINKYIILAIPPGATDTGYIKHGDFFGTILDGTWSSTLFEGYEVDVLDYFNNTGANDTAREMFHERFAPIAAEYGIKRIS
jgi:hypothetical protein